MNSHLKQTVIRRLLWIRIQLSLSATALDCSSRILGLVYFDQPQALFYFG
jgi:hypothetical protein